MNEWEAALSEYYGASVRVVPTESKPTWTKVGDGSVWPQPGEGFGDVEWRLRYGRPSREDLLAAASAIAAYSELIRVPRTKRELVIRALRQGDQQ